MTETEVRPILYKGWPQAFEILGRDRDEGTDQSKSVEKEEKTALKPEEREYPQPNRRSQRRKRKATGERFGLVLRLGEGTSSVD